MGLPLLLAAAFAANAAMIDLNHNGMSDIWEYLFGATGLDPQADADNDGYTNLQESLAGTDPFDPSSYPHATSALALGPVLNISMASALGKRYEMQTLVPLPDVPWTNWVTGAVQVARNGSTVNFSVPVTNGAVFFRILISDVDTANSGVNDWEKYQLGLDPFSTSSNGQLDSVGRPLGDLAFVTDKLAAQNTITVVASDPVAVQPDPVQGGGAPGEFTVLRGGFPLNLLIVNLTSADPVPNAAVAGLDYEPLDQLAFFPPGSSSAVLPLQPLTDTNLTSPRVASLRAVAGVGYHVGSPAGASVVIQPSAVPTGVGLLGKYFTNASPTYASPLNFNPANLILTRVDPAIDFVWGAGAKPISNAGRYSVRWTGQVRPQYSETYYFDVNSSAGVKLWVNDQPVIDRWVSGAAGEAVGQISLQAGVRYDIRLEYFTSGGNPVVHLYWYSASQPRQIIPAGALYPGNDGSGGATVTSPLSAVAFLGQPFTFALTGANGARSFSATSLPPGLSLDTGSGLITGTPNLAGDFQAVVTAANANGTGVSVLDIKVLDTGSSVAREVWLGVAGNGIADIPTAQPPSFTNFLGSLEGITGFGTNYAERVRGYFTAPATGNYYFWIAGGDAAELWLSDDQEPVNRMRRAYVSPAAPTGPRQWTQSANQRSGWLSLIAGQAYYLEVLHKTGAGTNDNWSVGWSLDPTGTNVVPGGVVPGYLLSRYFDAPAGSVSGALYSANLVAADGVKGTPSGSATLRVSPDGSQAVLKFKLAGLSSPVIGEHILCDPYLNNPTQILFDISAATPQPDGSYVWPITAIGTFQSAADVLEALRENKAYLTVLTAANPSGEVTGHFTLANGTTTFVPPPPPPAWPDDHTDPKAAARFLIQTTFGPQAGDVAAVVALGYEGWLDDQMKRPASHHLPGVLATKSADPTTPYPATLSYGSWWRQSVTAPDQLRQRVAFALSEIMVTSAEGVLADNARALSAYYDVLLDNAFGNYRQLLQAVTLSPAMGLYLNMLGNDKGSIITGIHANENYAREVMQLFSIGLNRLWPDGTLVLNSDGNPVPTYNQDVILGMAAEFTGWHYHQPNQANGRLPANFNPAADYVNPMVLVPAHHDLGSKRLLDNVMAPPAWGSQTNPANADFDAYCLNDLPVALDSIFNHPNVGPYICRQLIQRLVTSHPSRGYLYRVVQVFNDNGAGQRGDLAAVVKAILLDYEARSPALLAEPTFGKQREPVLRVTAVARAFPAPPAVGGVYSQTGTPVIQITTTNAHRLNNGDVAVLTFSDSSGQPAPGSRAYTATVNGPMTFTVNSPEASVCTYLQTTNLTVTNLLTGVPITNGVIAVTLAAHGLNPGNSVYLEFTSGGAVSGTYQVVWTNGAKNQLIVLAPETATRSGGCLLPKLSAGGYAQAGQSVTVSINGAHGLVPGESVFLQFPKGPDVSGIYPVQTVPDAGHFTVVANVSADQAQTAIGVYPLAPPPFVRSGTVTVAQSSYAMGSTRGSLDQNPLASPTVFNFFYPDYQFPGALASAGLTTPEFQLTSDTSVAGQMNVFAGGLLNHAANTNGLSSFNGSDGAIVLDLSPWMTPNYTSNAGLASLVDALDALLTGGQLSPAAKSLIVRHVADNTQYPWANPPTGSQMHNRVRAAVHLLVSAPEFIIQR